MNEQPGAQHSGDASPPNGTPKFLKWLPWEKITIWGLVLLAIYALRHFFFVIFMTFIVSYSMRGIIVRVTWLFTGRRNVPKLERLLAVLCFLLLILGVYQAGRFLWPPLKRQYDQLVGRISQFDPQSEFDNLGKKTVGEYLFKQKYGDPDEDTYKEAFQVFRKDSNMIRPSAYDAFAKLEAEMQGGFDKEEIRALWVHDEVEKLRADQESFDAWFRKVKAPAIYAEKKEELIEAYDAQARSNLPAKFLEELKERPDYESYRDSKILDGILADVAKNEEQLAAYKKEREDILVKRVEERIETSDQLDALLEEKLRRAYEDKKKAASDDFPHEFERYLVLKAAFEQANVDDDKAVFYAVIETDPDISEEDLLRQQERDFVLAKQLDEWKDWWRDDAVALQVRSAFNKYSEEAVTEAGVWARSAIKYALTLPVQLALSLLLSFFITFDIPKLRKGVAKIKESRVSGLYAEIAPGLISFGHLIGRAFQAQGVIAIFNTLLTFLVVGFLQIDNGVFLCSIVFLCSFIPVLGVVLSSVPIAIMAIVQPTGSLTLAVQATAAIIAIHFIETSILNPKILGDMLHLHPVMVLAVLAVGEHFFGIWGLLLGVPVAVYIIRFVILDEGIPGLIEPLHAATSVASGELPLARGQISPDQAQLLPARVQLPPDQARSADQKSEIQTVSDADHDRKTREAAIHLGDAEETPPKTEKDRTLDV